MTIEIIPADQRALDGALAAALAKAQGDFPAIQRDKTVTVTSQRTGKSYTFKYAPLDSILNAVRKPLAENGLALSQLLDSGDLVTMLIHSDGGSLTGRLPIPAVEGVQEFGSAVTYLRRYSIQAILGIAAEEDDDGNRAAGNDAKFGQTPAQVNAQERARLAAAADHDDGGLIGTVVTEKGYDFELRQTPTGYVLPFRVKNGTKSFIVFAEDKLAEALSMIAPRVIGQRVTVWGHWTDETIPAKGTKPQINYRVLHLERIETPDGMLPPVEDTGPEPPPDVSLPFEGEALPPPLGLDA